MGEEHVGVGAEQLLQPLAPGPARGGRRDRPEQLVQDRRMQLGGIADVDVQRGRPGVELLRQATHGDLLQALLAHDPDGGRDDALPGEGGLRGALPAAVGSTGVCCHPPR